MKEDIARGWAAYLRTPGLKQATGRLMREDGSACCLGHLCEYLGVEKKFSRNGDSYLFLGEGELLPSGVREQVGMNTECGTPVDYDGFDIGKEKFWALTDVNDQSGLTLPEIADLIEANWERL